MTNYKRGELVDNAYNILKKKIITQDIKPGEYLDEKILMKELGIGRTPLRQAIMLLKKDNFIEGQPNKSPYVKEFSLGEVKELFETLMIIEKNITYLAVLRVTDEEIKRIEAIQTDIDKAIQEKVFWKITDYNLRFHHIIALASKNRYLFEIHKNIRSQAERLSYIAVSQELETAAGIDKHNKRISAQHHELIKCLKERDTKQIEVTAIEHIKLFQNRILNSLIDLSYL